MSRSLGAGFIGLVVAVVALIGWQLAAEAPSDPVSSSEVDVVDGVVENGESASEVGPGSPPAEARFADLELREFSGELRPDVDATLVVGPGQGVLELSGPSEVTVSVDGIDRGALPIVLVLDQGRHVVRYEHQGHWSVRFYFVKSGATRALEAITRPGGFVDAH